MGNRFLVGMLVALALALGTPGWAGETLVVHPARHDLSPPLSDLAAVDGRSLARDAADFDEILEILTLDPSRELPRAAADTPEIDAALQDYMGATNMPAAEVSFDGLHNVNGVLPPDPSGDVGPNHYVQAVNLSLAVWDKEGNLLLGPLAGNRLFSGFGGMCESHNNGDPIVLYDPLADRWMYSQFALGFPADFHQCIAVSQTPDPTGPWYRYDFEMPGAKMNDYPKFGVWPDGYYMTVNHFDGYTTAWAGSGVAVFERDKMLGGLPARMIYVDLYDQEPYLASLLPADLDGATAPPEGEPNYLLTIKDGYWWYGDGFSGDRIDLWKFAIDWNDTSSYTLARVKPLYTQAFDSQMCGGARNCIPQPGTDYRLDAIAGRPMFRLAYRNFGDHQSMAFNHTVDVDGADHAGVRWYELRNEGQSALDWRIHQQGTFAPDGDHRWMGSVAMDREGNLAVGYAVSGNDTYPSVAYAGRLFDADGDGMEDAANLGVLTQGEQFLVEGGGVQLHYTSRFGDYSALTVDPSDDCTFWYTQEYYASTSSAGWRTRIGSFRFPSCSNEPLGTIEGSVSDGGNPVAGASVAAGAFSATTDADGYYRLGNLPVDTYTVSASAYGYLSASVSAVAVIDGGTATADFALTAKSDVVVRGTVRDGGDQGWPLYARIDIAGYDRGAVYTDPVSGEYSVVLPETGDGEDGYGFTVTAFGGGYETALPTVQVSVGMGNQDFALTPGAECTAPGYALQNESCVAQEGGLVVGHVYDANSDGALMAALVASGGSTTTTVGTPYDEGRDDGFYILFQPAGSTLVTAAKSGYGNQQATVSADPVAAQDFTLSAAQLLVYVKDSGEDATKGVSMTLYPGASESTLLVLSNGGSGTSRFELKELNVPASAITTNGPFADAGRRTSPKHLVDADASSVRYYEPPYAEPLCSDTGVCGGGVLERWTTDLEAAWGIGYDLDEGDLWLGNSSVAEGVGIGDGLDHRYDVDVNGSGITRSGDTIDTSTWATVFAADITYDPWTRTLWQLNVGGDNCVYELDPDFVVQAPTGNKICPPFGNPQHGLAYDWHTETFYSGSWNDQIIYHFDKNGTVLDSKTVGLNVAGLAFNPMTRHLFVLTNAEEGLDVYVLDTEDYYCVIGGYHIDELGAYAQGGMTMDCDGRLWIVDTVNQEVVLAESGETSECEFLADEDPIPWLTESPVLGEAAAGGSVNLTFTFSAEDLAPGFYEGQVKVRNDSPYGTLTIPVTLTVLDRHTITAAAGSHGSIDPEGEVHVLDGDGVLFNVEADSGYHILDLLVDGEPIEEAAGQTTFSYSFSNVQADHTIVASFSDSFVISASASIGGTIDPVGQVPVTQGDDVTFNFEASPHFFLVHVKVDDVVVGDPTSYTFTEVSGNHTIYAEFDPVTYNITTTAGDHGSVLPEGVHAVIEGSGSLIRFYPDEGYHVDQVLVDGAPVTAANQYFFDNVAEDHTLHVDFAINQYTLTPSAGEHGSIDPADPVTVLHGEGQTFTITPESGYQVANVYMDEVSQGAVDEYTFSDVSADHTVHATFEVETILLHTVSAAAGVGGSVTPSGSVLVAEGSSQTFVITPDENYEIVDVLVDGSSVGALTSYTFAFPLAEPGAQAETHTLMAVFNKSTFTIAASAAENGSIEPRGEVEVNRGEEKAFTITPDAGYEIDRVTVDGVFVQTDGTYVFYSVSDDHEITVTFKPKTYNIEATVEGLGQIEPSGTVPVVYGEDQTFALTPNLFQQLDALYVDGISQPLGSDYTFTSVNQNHRIHAVFGSKRYTITVITKGGGGDSYVTPDGEVLVEHGAGTTIRVFPDATEGYYVDDVLVDGESVGAVEVYTFEDVTTDHTIEVEFLQGVYEITPLAGDHGSINPGSTQTVYRGGSLAFTITPAAEEYAVTDIQVGADEESLESVDSVDDYLLADGSGSAQYTFSNVQQDYVIRAVFGFRTHQINVLAYFDELLVDGFAIPAGGWTEEDPEVGIFTVNHGKDATFEFKQGQTTFLIHELIVDDVVVPENVWRNKNYTFENVTEDHTMEIVLNEIVREEDEDGNTSFGCFIRTLGAGSAPAPAAAGVHRTAGPGPGTRWPATTALLLIGACLLRSRALQRRRAVARGADLKPR